jgi:hypothetical protein
MPTVSSVVMLVFTLTVAFAGHSTTFITEPKQVVSPRKLDVQINRHAHLLAVQEACTYRVTIFDLSH